MTRPDCIKHWKEIQEPDNGTYPGSQELLSIGSPFGRHFGFARLGIHHELLPPGRRTSWPHCEETEDEFIYVIEGTPDVWLDGDLVRGCWSGCPGWLPCRLAPGPFASRSGRGRRGYLGCSPGPATANHSAAASFDRSGADSGRWLGVQATR